MLHAGRAGVVTAPAREKLEQGNAIAVPADPAGRRSTSQDDNILYRPLGQSHAPGEGRREPLIIIVRRADGIAFTLQHFAEDIPQACISIE